MSVASYSDNWRALQKYVHLFPQNFHLVHSIAKGFYLDRNYTNAAKFYRKAIKINPYAEMDWEQVAFSIEDSDKNYEQAAYYYEKAYSKSTTHNRQLTQRLGWAYIQSKQYQNALDILLLHCQHDLTDDWSLGKIGHCYQMFQDYPTALEYHLKAEALGSTNLAWNTGNIGYCHQMMGRYDTALEYHLKAEKLDSSDLWNLKNIGYCYQKMGDYGKSLSYHQRVYDEDPADIWNLKNVGYSYQQLGNYEKALKYHLLIEKMSPDDTWNLGHIGYCYQRISKHKEALGYHKKIYELAPEDTWNKYQLGYCYFTQYDLENAEYYLRDGDDDKYALLHLGSVYFIQGKTYYALEKYKESLEMFDSLPNFMSVYTSDRHYLEGDYGLSAVQCDQMAWEIEMHNGFRDVWQNDK